MNPACHDGACSRPKPVHGAPKPKRVALGALPNPPVPCSFKVGDFVEWTNDYGLKWRHHVTGFAESAGEFGRFVYLDSDCYWAPHDPIAHKFRLLERATA